MTAPARPDSDEELLEQFRAGHRGAFEKIMRRHQTPIFNFILRSVRDRSLAEEILQDTWVRVIQGAADFQRSSKFSTWAYTVARNLCIDHARKASLRNHPSLDQPVGHEEGGRTLGDSVRDRGPAADRETIGRELRGKMLAAIEALPDDQREVFMLREYSELPFKEIAGIVGAPENTVKSRMRYALERLQDALGEYGDYVRALG